jgi:hypothetical protein
VRPELVESRLAECGDGMGEQEAQPLQCDRGRPVLSEILLREFDKRERRPSPVSAMHLLARSPERRP